MFRTWLSRSIPAISKSNRFPVVLPLLDLNSVISKPHSSKFLSTDSPMGPFVGSDDHVVRVVNRNGNACRQARVHWLLASLVVIRCTVFVFNLPNWVELPNYCMNVFTEWWAFFWCHYNQFNEAIDTPVKWNQTMRVTFCQSCMAFSFSKYVQFAHVTISDEMQSITISNSSIQRPEPSKMAAVKWVCKTSYSVPGADLGLREWTSAGC